jgi:lipopolysaccharide/colanic/teichoic acid biosynthesis glycosyltransferase
MLTEKDLSPWSCSESRTGVASPSRSWETRALDLPLPWKRLVDVAIASIVLLLSVPLLLVAMILVRATSPGPFLYTQTRLGRNRRRFTIYKIRSMTHHCEQHSGPCWSAANDPRVTRVGRFLRRSHLDEWPQLWNVLRGDMSLVGPRPERPEFVATLEQALPRYAERLTVRPGVTGLAQMKLPPDTGLHSVRRKLAYDLHYIGQGGPGLDVRILVGTGLFLVGIPFPISCRLLGLESEGSHPHESTAAAGLTHGFIPHTQVDPA